MFTSMGRDVEWMAPEVRSLLDALDISPNLPPDEEDWNPEQRPSFLQACNSTLLWDGRTPNFAGDPYDDRETAWNEALTCNPALYTKRRGRVSGLTHMAHESLQRREGMAVITLCLRGLEPGEAELWSVNLNEDTGDADCPECLEQAGR